MKPASSNLCTFAFAIAIFSSDILQSFCFLGFVEGLTWSLCSIILLLTHVRSEVFHVKTSLFLFKNESSSVSSSDVRS
jgi:hypothetical protein